jgi:hypothetical protein
MIILAEAPELIYMLSNAARLQFEVRQPCCNIITVHAVGSLNMHEYGYNYKKIQLSWFTASENPGTVPLEISVLLLVLIFAFQSVSESFVALPTLTL